MLRITCLMVIMMTIAMTSPSQSFAHSYKRLVIFSGSLSDTGNCASISCQEFPEPPYFKNRSSNGPVAVDILASLLKLSAAPSLHLVGPEQGTNYAVLGALAGGTREIDLRAQVQAYLGPRRGIAEPEALYFIFIGGNDVIAAVVQPDAAQQILVGAVDGIEDTVRTLEASGAKNLLVGNFIDVGTAPAFRDLGLAQVARLRTRQFNKLLSKRVRALESSLNIDILEFDFFEFGENFFASARELGFTNTTDSCLASAACNFERFVYFNETFPTARIHRLIGNEIVSDLVRQLSDRKRKSSDVSDRRP